MGRSSLPSISVKSSAKIARIRNSEGADLFVAMFLFSALRLTRRINPDEVVAHGAAIEVFLLAPSPMDSCVHFEAGCVHELRRKHGGVLLPD